MKPVKTGLLGGFLTGTVLSGLVLGGASVMTYQSGEAPDTTEVAVPAGSDFRQSREDEEASLPTSDAAPDAAEKPQIEAPEPDDLASVGEATESAAQPSTGEAAVGLTAPDAPDVAPGLSADMEEPVLPIPQTLAPQAPAGEDDLSISSEPAQPVQPDVGEGGAFEEEQTALVVPDGPADAAPEVQPEVTEPETAEPEVIEPEVVEPDVVAPEVAEPEQEPSATVGNLAENVTVGRLPSVADAEEAEDEPPQSRLERYSVEFENPEGKPLLSFVLLDEGDGSVGFQNLAGFPYPISYAVDVSAPGAADAMTRYREAGLEVLAMVDLPEGASASDAEVAMQTYLAQLPETVAVMEGVGSGLQSSREATEQLIPILQESGHGLVLFSEGLDTAQKLISREGVPAISVFRDVDGNGQSASVIRRFLDQAAFRAGQEEAGVVIVGRLRAETVSALLLWGLQDRANSVAIAPVSALLKQQVGG
ncbi:MAG: divergent polysaccharide deacetylase family protein [Pseudomonadota bacterium]